MLKSYFSSGCYVILDSGFCVLKAIIALKTVGGLFAGALIKKRRYWSTLVPGKAIIDYFATKAVGAVDAITGVCMTTNASYFIWGMKEPDYVMKIMATGGALSTDETCKIETRGTGENRISFPYTKPFDWHFRYRHIVDDPNNFRHAWPSLETTWIAERWPICVFTFLLAACHHRGQLLLGIQVLRLERRRCSHLGTISQRPCLGLHQESIT
jgi:hypothetical protein